MQKNDDRARNSAVTAFDSAFRRAYPNPYALPFSRQCDVLLLPDAGVWVGLTEIHPTHPANAGGFHFHPPFMSWEPGRNDFRNLENRIHGGNR
jgi:hypothetical protein